MSYVRSHGYDIHVGHANVFHALNHVLCVLHEFRAFPSCSECSLPRMTRLQTNRRSNAPGTDPYHAEKSCECCAATRTHKNTHKFDIVQNCVHTEVVKNNNKNSALWSPHNGETETVYTRFPCARYGPALTNTKARKVNLIVSAANPITRLFIRSSQRFHLGQMLTHLNSFFVKHSTQFDGSLRYRYKAPG